MHYTGKVLIGFSGAEIHDRILDGAEMVPTVRFVRFPQYKRGPICDRCASCYQSARKVHADGRVDLYPMVVTDARPGYLGETLRGD